MYLRSIDPSTSFIMRFRFLHCKEPIPKIRNKYSQSTVPISTFMCLCATYIFPRSILLQEICGLILGIYKSPTGTCMWKSGMRPRNSQTRKTQMGFSLQCVHSDSAQGCTQSDREKLRQREAARGLVCPLSCSGHCIFAGEGGFEYVTVAVSWQDV